MGSSTASAYVLRHQTSTVLEFWVRDRQGFGGLTGSLRDNRCWFQTVEHTRGLECISFEGNHVRVTGIGHIYHELGMDRGCTEVLYFRRGLGFSLCAAPPDVYCPRILGEGQARVLLHPKSPSELQPRLGSGVQPPTVLWPGLVQSVNPHFIISAYLFISPFLILLPHMFHVSEVCFVSCLPPRTPFRTPNPIPIPFYFASRPLVLFLSLCFSAQTHARFPRPCYVPFNTYTSIVSCMFLSLKLT